MEHARHFRKGKKAAVALERMYHAKEFVDQALIVGRILQLHQLLADAFQQTPGLRKGTAPVMDSWAKDSRRSLGRLPEHQPCVGQQLRRLHRFDEIAIGAGAIGRISSAERLRWRP